MIVTRLRLKNWRNFPELDLALSPRSYVIGANASGKSNLLDVFRFLRTVAQSEGGGLQKAVKDRGGLSKVRSLHARKDPEVRIEVELSASPDEAEPEWVYSLGFKSETGGTRRLLVSSEIVTHRGEKLISRPKPEDQTDTRRLTQTYLEQIGNNASFRPLVDFFAATTYLHLVPQLLKHGDEISGRMIENDPFGQGLLQRIAKTPRRFREARLSRIQQALSAAVPQFSRLQFKPDEFTGAPHLEARFEHWREHGAWQREEQFSDGTLRLIGLLWALQDGDGLLLLEEPELSLNAAIVRHIPLMMERVVRQRKKGLFVRQILVSTHSDVLISAVTDPGSVILLEPGEHGSTARQPDAEERSAMEHGLNPAEVMLPKTQPARVEQMSLF